MADANLTRFCPKCRETKPLSAFSIIKATGRPNGYCKKCRRELAKEYAAEHKAEKKYYNAQYRADHVDELREYDKERSKEPERRAQLDRSIASWKEKNPTKVLEINRRSDAKRAPKRREDRKANWPKYYARNRRWILAHPEKASAYTRAWRLTNPEQVRQNWRNRSARERNADGFHTASDIHTLLVKQQGICAYCPNVLQTSGKDRYHVDHDIPLCRGGTNWPSNLALACPRCNLQKYRMTGAEFRAYKAAEAEIAAFTDTVMS